MAGLSRYGIIAASCASWKRIEARAFLFSCFCGASYMLAVLQSALPKRHGFYTAELKDWFTTLIYRLNYQDFRWSDQDGTTFVFI